MLEASESTVISWYQKNKRSLPWREMFAQHASPYHVWVSEIMLQQTVIKAVIPKYLSFFERFPTVFDLAAAQEEDVRLACQGLGYYRRFKLMHNCAKKLCENKNEKNFAWPGSYKEWLSYPGIGTYTASAISGICLSEAQMVVDGNVERLMCRLHDIRLEPNLAPLKKIHPLGQRSHQRTGAGRLQSGTHGTWANHLHEGKSKLHPLSVEKSCLNKARKPKTCSSRQKEGPIRTDSDRYTS